jgi:hypothetical protein
MDKSNSESVTGRTGGRTRRRFLLGLGVSSTVAVAGCTGGSGGTPTETSASATPTDSPTDTETSTPTPTATPTDTPTPTPTPTPTGDVHEFEGELSEDRPQAIGFDFTVAARSSYSVDFQVSGGTANCYTVPRSVAEDYRSGGNSPAEIRRLFQNNSPSAVTFEDVGQGSGSLQLDPGDYTLHCRYESGGSVRLDITAEIGAGSF